MSNRASPRAGAALAAAAALLAVLPAFAALPALQWPGGKPTLAKLLERVTPAVVNIAVVSRAPAARNPLLMDPFFRRFFGIPDDAPLPRQQSAGSGVIVDAEKGTSSPTITSSRTRRRSG